MFFKRRSGYYDDTSDAIVMSKECRVCDGTGSVCGACNASIMDCNCGPDQMPTMCDACAGTGDEPIEPANAEKR